MNVRELILNMTLWVRQSSPNFTMLRQSSHEGARMLPVYPGGIPWNLPDLPPIQKRDAQHNFLHDKGVHIDSYSV